MNIVFNKFIKINMPSSLDIYEFYFDNYDFSHAPHDLDLFDNIFAVLYFD